MARVDEHGTEWRDVVGFEGRYEVCREGVVRNVRTGRAMKQIRRGLNTSVNLYECAGIDTKVRVKDAVALAFSSGVAAREVSARSVICGDMNGQATHSDDVVRYAREEVAKGSTVKEVGMIIGASDRMVRRWVTGVTRMSAGGPIQAPAPSGESYGQSLHHKSKVGNDVVLKARLLYREGASIRDISEKTGSTDQAVLRWVRGKCRLSAGGPIAPPRSARRPEPQPANIMISDSGEYLIGYDDGDVIGDVLPVKGG